MSKSVASLTADDFEPHTGETFHLKTTKGALELKLVEVQRLDCIIKQRQALGRGGSRHLEIVSWDPGLPLRASRARAEKQCDPRLYWPRGR